MKILVSKPDSLGDQIIVAGFVQQLAKEHPTAQIIWQVRAPMQVVSSILPNVRLFEPDFEKTPADETKRLDENAHSGITILPLPIDPCADWTTETDHILDWWIRFLKNQEWDLSITALRNRTWLSELSAVATHATRRLALAKTNAWQSFAEPLRTDLHLHHDFHTEEVAFSYEESEYESYARLFAACSAKHYTNSIRLTYPKAEQFQQKTVLLAPGVGFHHLRSWPIDKWIHLSELLSDKGWNVSWIQGPGDERFYLHHPIPSEKRIIFGPNDLPKLASAIDAANALVCNDSSYAHLGAAIGTPTLAFYGCGQKKRFVPNRGKVKVIQGETIEAGSQWHNHCDIWASIREIPMNETLQAFDALIDRDDTTLVSIPIDIADAPEELKNPNTRTQFLDNYQKEFWESWSRVQTERRNALKDEAGTS